MFFIQSLIFERFLIDFELQNESKFETNCPKIDPKFKSNFEGRIWEIFGDLGAQKSTFGAASENLFSCFFRDGRVRASSEREGKA